MAGPRKRLLELWRQRVHPTATREQVAIAFALLAGGAVVSVLGVVVITLGDTLLTRPSWLREVGFVAAASGLPLFLTGIVAGLPSRPWIAVLSLAGLAASIVGVGIFVALYPDRWYLTVQTPNTYAIGSYMGGVSLLAAGASAAMASSFVERHTADRREAATDAPGVSDEEVQADLAWGERQGWDWGGMPAGDRGIEITLRGEDEPVSFIGRGRITHREEQPATETIDAARALSWMRGEREPKEEGDVDDQVGHLRRLRAKQQEAQEGSIWWKLTHPGSWFHD